MEIDSDTLDELVDLLTPLVRSEQDRRALLGSALIGCPVLEQINYTGATRSFLVNMLSTLADYGECEPGKPALWLLLDAARGQVGIAQQRRVDALRYRLHTSFRPGDPRAEYLAWRAEDVDERLRTSIHEAVFINLSAEERQHATRPWTFKSNVQREEPEDFDNFDAAFERYRRRVLILGTPGAGKTTTLLKETRELLAGAMDDPGAPVPLLLNLSLWREDDVDKPFADWLIAQTAGLRGAGVDKRTAREWIKSGGVALLLDGLDEVDESRRARLVQAMNAYFNEHTKMTVIVCSRVDEYNVLQANVETKLWLEGAVVLQALGDGEIDNYLTQAGADDLRALLRGDAALYELARAPLTLSMMTLAYGGLSPDLIPAGLPVVERRRHLFDMYTRRMLQRKERRDAANPEVPADHFEPDFDDYTYTPEEVNKYLGWLGVRLGEQAKTEFPLDGIYRFLEAAPDENWLNAVNITNAISGFVVSLMLVFAVMLVWGEIAKTIYAAPLAGLVSFVVSLFSSYAV